MKGQMLKLFVVVTVCLSVAAGCAWRLRRHPRRRPCHLPRPRRPSTSSRRYQDAVARHDVDAAHGAVHR